MTFLPKLFEMAYTNTHSTEFQRKKITEKKKGRISKVKTQNTLLEIQKTATRSSQI